MKITILSIVTFLTFFSVSAQSRKYPDIDSLIKAITINIREKDTISLRGNLQTFRNSNPRTSQIYSIYKRHGKYITKFMGNDDLLSQIQGAIGKEYIDPLMAETCLPDWSALENKLVKKYPGVYKKPFLIGKFNYAMKKGNPELIAECGEDLRTAFPETMPALVLNNTAYIYLFLKSNDLIVLNTALTWSKVAIKESPSDPEYFDTYANILYKLGRKEEAISAIDKAISLGNLEESSSYRDNKAKMQKGLPTW